MCCPLPLPPHKHTQMVDQSRYNSNQKYANKLVLEIRISDFLKSLAVLFIRVIPKTVTQKDFKYGKGNDTLGHH